MSSSNINLEYRGNDIQVLGASKSRPHQEQKARPRHFQPNLARLKSKAFSRTSSEHRQKDYEGWLKKVKEIVQLCNSYPGVLFEQNLGFELPKPVRKTSEQTPHHPLEKPKHCETELNCYGTETLRFYDSTTYKLFENGFTLSQNMSALPGSTRRWELKYPTQIEGFKHTVYFVANDIIEITRKLQPILRTTISFSQMFHEDILGSCGEVTIQSSTNKAPCQKEGKFTFEGIEGARPENTITIFARNKRHLLDSLAKIKNIKNETEIVVRFMNIRIKSSTGSSKDPRIKN